ncbi:MAG: GtrA family protein [Erysipelotrichaceae bacterium]|nr:GtrA family protein [Erysipelotrichaceae bacterium]
MDKILKNKLLMQIIKFVFVGGTAFLIDYYLLLFLTNTMNIHYVVSNVISFCVSVIYNYILSAFWVFEMDKNKSKTQTFVVFIVLSVIGLLINTVVVFLLYDATKIFALSISKIIATAIVMVYNFVSRKIFLGK